MKLFAFFFGFIIWIIAIGILWNHCDSWLANMEYWILWILGMILLIYSIYPKRGRKDVKGN